VRADYGGRRPARQRPPHQGGNAARRPARFQSTYRLALLPLFLNPHPWTMSFPNGTLRRLEFANKAVADELPVLHSRDTIIGGSKCHLWVKNRHRLPPVHVRFTLNSGHAATRSLCANGGPDAPRHYILILGWSIAWRARASARSARSEPTTKVVSALSLRVRKRP
jgi:hypothetical protein